MIFVWGRGLFETSTLFINSTVFERFHLERGNLELTTLRIPHFQIENFVSFLLPQCHMALFVNAFDLIARDWKCYNSETLSYITIRVFRATKVLPSA